MKLIRILFALCAVVIVFGGSPLSAQESAPRERVVIVPGARPLGGRIIQVAPRPAATPERAYEGVKQFRDWRWYGTAGPAIARARFEAYATRFAPTVGRYYSFGWSGWGGGYAHQYTRTWHR